ncbi:MAG: ligase-associated DNA damage response DEXH box helicase [Flavobacteriaceae bacterium]|nr:ligase-associated DNA damage response DEXH box helicase [Flavobacteriaceae bacterium]
MTASNKKFLQAYFEQKNWKSLPFQQEVWSQFLAQKSGLLNAPTGSGKTLAVLGGFLLNLQHNHPALIAQSSVGLQLLWITPLKALSKETLSVTENLLANLKIPWKVAIRSGDTPTKERKIQQKDPPEILITTPESLHLLLATKAYQKYFAALKSVVVDEWHEFLSTKRGVQIELAMSRLRNITKTPLLVWGITATIANFEEALRVLTSPLKLKKSQYCTIQSSEHKNIDFLLIIPEKSTEMPWRGHMGINSLHQLKIVLDDAKTTLIFTNTRNQCENWYMQLVTQFPEYAGCSAMHHGSLDKDTRLWVEDALKHERLKFVVCTSSLDLGVDFPAVEQVVQIGSPKGIARFLQRAGRSGHRPGVASKVYFLPTHALEVFEAAALKKAIQKPIVEARTPLVRCFDVLVQYLTTLACSEGFNAKAIFDEVKSTQAFKSMTTEEWQWCLNFLVYGGEVLDQYPDFQKLTIINENTYKIAGQKFARRHRMQIGTIVSDAMVQVQFLKGKTIGTLEEYFVSRLKSGDRFVFGGRVLTFIRFKEMTAYVKLSKSKNAMVPAWLGGKLPLSSKLSDILRAFTQPQSILKALPEAEPLLQYIFNRQLQESQYPKPDELLVETFKTREGYHGLIYPFEGRAVHEALGILMAYRIAQQRKITVRIAVNDYGIELLSDQNLNLTQEVIRELLQTKSIYSHLEQAINTTEIARRKFREIGVISGLVFIGYPGARLRERHLQSSTQLIFDVLKEHFPQHLLYRQAFDEAVYEALEFNRLFLALERMQQQRLILQHCRRPTPLAFPIMTDRLRSTLSSESFAERLKKMQLMWA